MSVLIPGSASKRGLFDWIVAVGIDLIAFIAVNISILLITDWSVLEVHSVSRCANSGLITYERMAWSVTGIGLLMRGLVWSAVLHTYVRISPWWHFIIPFVVLWCLYTRKIPMEHDLSLILLVCRCTGYAIIAEDYVQLCPNILVGLIRWMLLILAISDAAFSGHMVCSYKSFRLPLLISANLRNRVISYDPVDQTRRRSGPCWDP